MKIEQSIAKAKALSSPVRVKILQVLKQRPHTLSDVSRELKISKTNAKTHLAKLLAASLVEENSRSKWKYYSLVEKQRNLLLNPTSFAIFIACFTIYCISKHG